MHETRREKCLRMAEALGDASQKLGWRGHREQASAVSEAAALLRSIAKEVCENCVNSLPFNKQGVSCCRHSEEPIYLHSYCDCWKAKPEEEAIPDE